MTTEYTASLRLNKPDFRDPGWSNLVNDNMDNIDRAVSAALAGANFEIWANNTHWNEGQIAIDINTTPGSYWICNVTHTSAVSPTTFAQDRAAHPTYWSAFLFNYRARGAWTHDTQYLINDIAYDSSLGITGICKIAHISNHAGTINDDAANWDYIVNLPSSLPASSITYNPATSGLGVTNVQAAIDAVDAKNDAQDSRLSSLEISRTADEITIASHTTSIGTLQTQQTKDGFDVGDIKPTYNVTPRTGWLLMNDGTIGSAISGATNYASALAVTLYTVLYNGYTNTQCPVSGGRGASAAADFAANKTIQLPKVASRVIAAAGAGAGLSVFIAGGIVGEETHLSTAGEMPVHNHGGATGTDSVTHTHSYTDQPNTATFPGSGGPSAFVLNAVTAQTGTPSVTHTHSISNAGSGTAHNNIQPTAVVYYHIRALP